MLLFVAYFCFFDVARWYFVHAYELPRWAPQHWELMWGGWVFFGLGLITYTVGIGGLTWIP